MPEFQLPEETKYFAVEATVSEFGRDDEAFSVAKAVIEDTHVAADVLDSDGMPRMLKITAWIAHGGYPNLNREGFVELDLEEAVTQKNLFAPPYVGMVDFDHDFIPRGVWYKAEYGFDQKAGHYGIRAEGVLFAWRFPELADQLIAMQVREGRIRVSMACLAEWIEWEKDENGTEYALLRKPTFLATSVLSVMPADPHGDGTVEETPSKASEKRESQAATDTKAAYTLNLEWLATATDNEEEDMDFDALIAAMKQALGEVAEEQRDALKDLVEKASQLADVERELDETKSQLAEANDQAKDLQGKVEDADLALETAKKTVKELEEKVASLEEEKKGLEEFKAEVEEKTAEAEKQAKLDERLVELNEAAKEALDELKEKDEEKHAKFLARWAEQSDEEWTITLASLNATNKSYTDRSNEEGTLTTAGGGEDSKGPLSGLKSARWVQK